MRKVLTWSHDINQVIIISHSFNCNKKAAAEQSNGNRRMENGIVYMEECSVGFFKHFAVHCPFLSLI